MYMYMMYMMYKMYYNYIHVAVGTMYMLGCAYTHFKGFRLGEGAKGRSERDRVTDRES